MAAPADPEPQGSKRLLAQRVMEALETHGIHKAPRQIDSRKILVAPWNRSGAPPNVRHIHETILKSFVTKGFDSNRPQPGVCIKYESQEGKAALLAHNKAFTSGNPLLPTVYEQEAEYGSIALSHLNLSLRFIKQGLASPSTNISGICDAQPCLKEFVDNGATWWVLPEDLDPQVYLDISTWRNQDQNENQVMHEAEVLSTVVSSAKRLGLTQETIQAAQLVHAVQRKLPANVRCSTIQSLVAYFHVHLSIDHVFLIQEYLYFHSNRVNPAELTVAANFFRALADFKELNEAVYLRHYLLLTQYSTDKARASAVGPNTCNLLEIKLLEALCKKTKVVEQLEKTIVDLRNKYLPLLKTLTSEPQAHLDLQLLMSLLIRCALAKGAPQDLEFKVKLGQWSPKQAEVLALAWAKHLDSKLPEPRLAPATDSQMALTENDKVEIDLKNFGKKAKRPLKPQVSDGGSAASAGDEPQTTFKVGDMVTVSRRVTWTVPRAGDKHFRQDLSVSRQSQFQWFVCDDAHVVLIW